MQRVAWLPHRAHLVTNRRAELRPGYLSLTMGAGDLTTRPDVLIDGLRERDRRVFERCDGLPVVTCMGGGYCPDISTIVTIHANTIRELSALAAARSFSSASRTLTRG